MGGNNSKKGNVMFAKLEDNLYQQHSIFSYTFACKQDVTRTADKQASSQPTIRMVMAIPFKSFAKVAAQLATMELS